MDLTESVRSLLEDKSLESASDSVCWPVLCRLLIEEDPQVKQTVLSFLVIYDKWSIAFLLAV